MNSVTRRMWGWCSAPAVLGYVMLLIIMTAAPAHAQRYTFTHYDIENGLVQSQVNKVYQDASHRLWIASLGGATRFDGRDYFTVSKATGLVNNFVYDVFCDRSGNTWLGTNRGLACLNGQQLDNLPTPTGYPHGWVTHVVQDGQGTIWGIMDNMLFKVKGHTLVHAGVNKVDDKITTLAVDSNGRLYAYAYGMGVYRLNGNHWELLANTPAQYPELFVTHITINRQGLFALAYRGLFTVQNRALVAYEPELLKEAKAPFYGMAFDAAGDLWLGAGTGAYYLSKGRLTHFDGVNGLADNAVSDIYCDRDNNIWLATQGSGIFKYDGDEYVMYSVTPSMRNNPIVMGIGHDRQNNALLGTDGSGVLQYDGKNIKQLWAGPNMQSRRIECLFTDHNGDVWVGTSLGGIWKYNGKQFEVLKGTENNSVNCIAEDEHGTIWLATPMGVYYYEGTTLNRLPQINSFASSLLVLGNDSLLVGTQEGVQLLVKHQETPGFRLKDLNSSSVLCMLKYGRYVFLGTDDRGIFAWDRKTGRVENYGTADGLRSNIIYSLATDPHGNIWTGTGRGVNRFRFSAQDMHISVLGGSEAREQITETNQNAILYHNGRMLVGTTKGLAVYNTEPLQINAGAPFVTISAVRLFEQGGMHSQVLNMPPDGASVRLSASSNHLYFDFLGIYLKDPAGVKYQYRLTGLEDKFCTPVKNDMVDYPSLPPGKYTFEVRAVSPDGQVSKNTASFRFEITPPFYRTYIFQFGVVVLFICGIVILQNYLHQRKIQRQMALEKMKREEKMKIRQQTAEDFHDDLGNKLTRITVLSDILDAKLGKEASEQKGLVLQIKQNAAALYNGTRDILWAMDPKSDNLYEVLKHIKDIGVELFQDMPVTFRFDAPGDELAAIKLPMEYSRNITMIFKEMLTNILKHAEATEVTFTYRVDKIEAVLRMEDNGRGFDSGTKSRGHGLNNVQARAKRIGGRLTVSSVKDEGTKVELIFDINKRV